ncbi:antitoxin [Pasteurellaceae bacterium Orientalotternb1]|nr:antitoxin [Pasteurellaceae bacterium Orientalotternb1]
MQTKVFQSGNSQAVRIPVDFRFDVDTVEIFKQDNGDVVLRPIPKETQNTFLALFENFDDGFIEALENRENPQIQERETL